MNCLDSPNRSTLFSAWISQLFSRRNWSILVCMVVLSMLISSCDSLTDIMPGDTNSAQIAPYYSSGSTSPTFTPFQPASPADLTATAGIKTSSAEPVAATQLMATNTAQQSPSQIGSSTQAVEATPSSDPELPVPEPPAGALTIWIDPYLPISIQENLSLPPELTLWDFPNADLRLELARGRLISDWVYAVVAPFPTVTYGVSFDELIASWRGEGSGPFAGTPLLMDLHTSKMLTELWGDPAPGAIKVLPGDQLLVQAWNNHPSWAVIPFENSDPRWKVLEVGGQSPLRNDFDTETYPLVGSISLNGDIKVADAIEALYGPQTVNPMLPATNRKPDRLTVLAMTGVTALVRATAFTMEQRGVLYPGGDVRPWLLSADLTHISNEVPFAKDCPYPDPVQQGMIFCSDPRYIRLLEDIGSDIIELTGDHFADWGDDAMYQTIDLYQERGWGYYGGGTNIEDGRRALKIEHNGNRLAFIGCNAKGGGYAQANQNRPGAVPCDFDWMSNEIQNLRNEGYLPIVTFQHFEYYTYHAQKPQIRDSRAMADAGAVIVSGSQAHQPQAIEFTDDTFIHYGLGNLFFDQYEVSEQTRQGFIDRHVFYDGKHIGTELLPIVFIDYARPRPMTVPEREGLLDAVFRASGW